MTTTQLSVPEQIEALERTAEELFEQRIGVLRHIRELRGRLEEVEYVRVAVDSPSRRQEVLDPAFAAQITDFLGDNPGSAVSDVAQALQAPVEAVSGALRRLEQLDTVHRTGIKRGTKWFLGDDGEEFKARNVAPDVRDARALVRDIAIELSRRGNVFQIGDVEAKCDLAGGTIRQWLRYWVDRGVLEVAAVTMEIDGRNRPVKVYAYVEPKTSPLPEKKRTPEEELKGFVPRRANLSVGSTPSWFTHMPQISRDFVRELELAGCTVKATKASGHVKVLYAGNYVGGVDWLAGDKVNARAIEITRQALVRNGVPLNSTRQPTG